MSERLLTSVAQWWNRFGACLSNDFSELPAQVHSVLILRCMLQAASGVTTAHLHAAMWEFSCGGAAVPTRVSEELRALPPRALSAMVRLWGWAFHAAVAGSSPLPLHQEPCLGSSS